VTHSALDCHVIHTRPNGNRISTRLTACDGPRHRPWRVRQRRRIVGSFIRRQPAGAELSPFFRGDVPHNERNFQDDLEAVLKGDFDFKGKFALSETFASTPLPGLHIDGIGVIGFPLSERDAKLIEAAATQAPFGKGTETVVDTTVRDTFEINPDKFSFKNPAWTEFLQTVTKKVADGLGLPPNRLLPRAELYKLLLYKAGSQCVYCRFLCISRRLTILQFFAPQGVRPI
jgi:hypothetical protein